jgi:integrase
LSVKAAGAEMARPSKTAAIDFNLVHDLTHGLIDRSACPDGVPFVLLKDRVKKGLRVRLTKAGGKHWQFETRVKGKLFTRSLGEWPAVSIETARKEAHRLRGLTEQGYDPRVAEREQAEATRLELAEKERAANFTFAALLSDYADQLEKLGRVSHSKVRGIFAKHLIEAAPELAKTSAALITSEDVTNLMRRLNDEGKRRTAGKFRSYVRAAFEMARTAGTDSELPVRFKSYAVRHNPAAETKAIKRNDDKNPLLPLNLRQYWGAIKSMSGVRGAALRVHLLTGGQRIEQLCKLRTEDVKTESIVLLDGKGRIGRAPRVHEVPLIAPALFALNELMTLSAGGEYVFSVNGGVSPIGSKTLSEWAKAAAAGVDWVTVKDSQPVGVFQAKRIRSGVETALASLKVSQEVRGHLLSHGVAGVQAASYDGHDYLDVKREALETLFRYLENVTANVTHVSFERVVA